jgi:hypothetical protein
MDLRRRCDIRMRASSADHSYYDASNAPQVVARAVKSRFLRSSAHKSVSGSGRSDVSQDGEKRTDDREGAEVYGLKGYGRYWLVEFFGILPLRQAQGQDDSKNK